MKYSKIIDAVYEEVLKGENAGTVPTYIPELAQVNPEQSISIASTSNLMA